MDRFHKTVLAAQGKCPSFDLPEEIKKGRSALTPPVPSSKKRTPNSLHPEWSVDVDAVDGEEEKTPVTVNANAESEEKWAEPGT